MLPEVFLPGLVLCRLRRLRFEVRWQIPLRTWRPNSLRFPIVF